MITGDTYVNGMLSNSGHFSFNNKLYDAETIFKKIDIPTGIDNLVYNGLVVKGFILNNDDSEIYTYAERELHTIKDVGTYTNHALYKYNPNTNTLDYIHHAENIAIQQWVLLKNSGDTVSTRNKFWFGIGVNISESGKYGKLAIILWRYGETDMKNNWLSYTFNNTNDSSDPFNYIVTDVQTQFKTKINSNTYAPCYSCLYRYKKNADELTVYTGLALFSIAVDRLFNPNKPFNAASDYKHCGVKMAKLLVSDVPDTITRINRSTYIVTDGDIETMYNISTNRKRYFYDNDNNNGGDYWETENLKWPDESIDCRDLLLSTYRIQTSVSWTNFISDTTKVAFPSGKTINASAFWSYAPKFTITTDDAGNIIAKDVSAEYTFVTQNVYTTLRSKGITCTLYKDDDQKIYLGFRFSADNRPTVISNVSSLDKTNLVRIIPTPIGSCNDLTKTILYTHRASDVPGSDVFYLYTLIDRTIRVFRISVDDIITYNETTSTYSAVGNINLNTLHDHDSNKTIGDESDYDRYINHDILDGVVTHCFIDRMYKYDIPSKQLTVTPFKLPSNITDLTKMNFGYDMMTYSDTVYVLTRGIVITEDFQSDQLMNMINRMHYMTTALIELSDRVAALETALKATAGQ